MFRTFRGKPRTGKRQRGQAIYLAFAAIIFLSLMTFASFNISQMTHGKTQTMNAADAGAYTFATIVARDLNFMAYTNRAMVANHAVIGQLVSFASLGEMIYIAASDLSYLQYLSWIPYIGSVLEAIGEACEELADIMDDDVLPMLVDFTEIYDGLLGVMSGIQAGIRVATIADLDNVGKVIKANDPHLEWDLSSGAGWLAIAESAGAFLNGFTEQRDDDDAKGRMRDVINHSRDGFTIRRAWLPVPHLPLPQREDSKHVFHGGTELSSDDNKTWVGVDGLSIQYDEWDDSEHDWDSAEISFWLTGAVAGGSGADDWEKLSHGAMSSGAHSAAYDNRKDRMEDAYSGIREYYELSGDPEPGEHPSDAFVVLVYKPVENATTPNATQTFGTDADNPFHLDEGRARIYGVAAAQVYFRRPAKNDGDPSAGKVLNTTYNEGTYATLFSPYWQPRLTDLPASVTAGLLLAADE
ncbi:MAG: hypothetical protein LBE85_09680 [Candidatus Accumulibacter sp.]|jgi:hypothetical protein|nr:hypothetical protein [Accumulibacter sp.]